MLQLSEDCPHSGTVSADLAKAWNKHIEIDLILKLRLQPKCSCYHISTLGGFDFVVKSYPGLNRGEWQGAEIEISNIN
jgi:hypothetical protein